MNPDEYARQKREEFEAFVKIWSAENIHYLERTDPSDVRYMIKRWGEQLKEAVSERGLLVGLHEVARVYGGTYEYVRALYERVESRRRGLG